jgi:hypothetical protein
VDAENAGVNGLCRELGAEYLDQLPASGGHPPKARYVITP